MWHLIIDSQANKESTAHLVQGAVQARRLETASNIRPLAEYNFDHIHNIPLKSLLSDRMTESEQDFLKSAIEEGLKISHEPRPRISVDPHTGLPSVHHGSAEISAHNRLVAKVNDSAIQQLLGKRTKTAQGVFADARIVINAPQITRGYAPLDSTIAHEAAHLKIMKFNQKHTGFPSPDPYFIQNLNAGTHTGKLQAKAFEQAYLKDLQALLSTPNTASRLEKAAIAPLQEYQSTIASNVDKLLGKGKFSSSSLKDALDRFHHQVRTGIRQAESLDTFWKEELAHPSLKINSKQAEEMLVIARRKMRTEIPARIKEINTTERTTMGSALKRSKAYLDEWNKAKVPEKIFIDPAISPGTPQRVYQKSTSKKPPGSKAKGAKASPSKAARAKAPGLKVTGLKASGSITSKVKPFAIKAIRPGIFLISAYLSNARYKKEKVSHPATAAAINAGGSSIMHYMVYRGLAKFGARLLALPLQPVLLATDITRVAHDAPPIFAKAINDFTARHASPEGEKNNFTLLISDAESMAVPVMLNTVQPFLAKVYQKHLKHIDLIQFIEDAAPTIADTVHTYSPILAHANLQAQLKFAEKLDSALQSINREIRASAAAVGEFIQKSPILEAVWPGAGLLGRALQALEEPEPTTATPTLSGSEIVLVSHDPKEGRQLKPSVTPFTITPSISLNGLNIAINPVGNFGTFNIGLTIDIAAIERYVDGLLGVHQYNTTDQTPFGEVRIRIKKKGRGLFQRLRANKECMTVQLVGTELSRKYYPTHWIIDESSPRRDYEIHGNSKAVAFTRSCEAGECLNHIIKKRLAPYLEDIEESFKAGNFEEAKKCAQAIIVDFRPLGKDFVSHYQKQKDFCDKQIEVISTLEKINADLENKRFIPAQETAEKLLRENPELNPSLSEKTRDLLLEIKSYRQSILSATEKLLNNDQLTEAELLIQQHQKEFKDRASAPDFEKLKITLEKKKEKFEFELEITRLSNILERGEEATQSIIRMLAHVQRNLGPEQSKKLVDFFVTLPPSILPMLYQTITLKIGGHDNSDTFNRLYLAFQEKNRNLGYAYSALSMSRFVVSQVFPNNQLIAYSGLAISLAQQQYWLAASQAMQLGTGITYNLLAHNGFLPEQQRLYFASDMLKAVVRFPQIFHSKDSLLQFLEGFCQLMMLSSDAIARFAGNQGALGLHEAMAWNDLHRLESGTITAEQLIQNNTRNPLEREPSILSKAEQYLAAILLTAQVGKANGLGILAMSEICTTDEKTTVGTSNLPAALVPAILYQRGLAILNTPSASTENLFPYVLNALSSVSGSQAENYHLLLRATQAQQQQALMIMMNILISEGIKCPPIDKLHTHLEVLQGRLFKVASHLMSHFRTPPPSPAITAHPKIQEDSPLQPDQQAAPADPVEIYLNSTLIKLIEEDRLYQLLLELYLPDNDENNKINREKCFEHISLFSTSTSSELVELSQTVIKENKRTSLEENSAAEQLILMLSAYREGKVPTLSYLKEKHPSGNWDALFTAHNKNKDALPKDHLPSAFIERKLAGLVSCSLAAESASMEEASSYFDISYRCKLNIPDTFWFAGSSVISSNYTHFKWLLDFYQYNDWALYQQQFLYLNIMRDFSSPDSDLGMSDLANLLRNIVSPQSEHLTEKLYEILQGIKVKETGAKRSKLFYAKKTQEIEGLLKQGADPHAKWAQYRNYKDAVTSNTKDKTTYVGDKTFLHYVLDIQDGQTRNQLFLLLHHFGIKVDKVYEGNGLNYLAYYAANVQKATPLHGPPNKEAYTEIKNTMIRLTALQVSWHEKHDPYQAGEYTTAFGKGGISLVSIINSWFYGGPALTQGDHHQLYYGLSAREIIYKNHALFSSVFFAIPNAGIHIYPSVSEIICYSKIQAEKISLDAFPACEPAPQSIVPTALESQPLTLANQAKQAVGQGRSMLNDYLQVDRSPAERVQILQSLTSALSADDSAITEALGHPPLPTLLFSKPPGENETLLEICQRQDPELYTSFRKKLSFIG